MKKNGLNGKVCDLSVSYETINVSYTEDIHKYLMKKAQYYIILNAWIHLASPYQWVSVNNEQCMIRPKLINLNLEAVILSRIHLVEYV